MGRFTTQDSFLGDIDTPPSLHRYQYAFANPTRCVDPSGHENLQWEHRQATCDRNPGTCSQGIDLSGPAGTRASGALRLLGGVGLVAAGVAGAPETAGGSLALVGAGIDQAITGLKEVVTGEAQKSIFRQAAERTARKAGLSEAEAERSGAAAETLGLGVPSVGALAHEVGAAPSVVTEPLGSAVPTVPRVGRPAGGVISDPPLVTADGPAPPVV